MPQSFKLPCPACDRTLTITATQAGESLQCECGSTVNAPTLREIRQLEPVGDSVATADPSTAGWNPIKGLLFVLGSVLIVAGLIGHFRINPQRQALTTEAPAFKELNVDIQSIAPTEAWDAWDHFRRQDLEFRETPEFLANREKHRELSYYLYLCWAAAALGMGMVAASFVMPGRGAN